MLGSMKKLAGLSIEQSGVRYVRLSKKTKDIDKHFFLPLEPGVMEGNQIRDRDALCAELKAAVSNGRLKGTEVFLSVPPTQMIIRKLSVPATNSKQLDQLIQLEVETGLHLPFEHPVYDYVVTNTGDENTEMLIFASPREVIQTYVDVVEEAGLKVAGVEISGTALSRLITIGCNKDFGETMLIQLETSYLDVYMFYNGHPVFMRTMNLYDLGDQQGEMSSLKLGEISAEISRMLNFYQYTLHDGVARIQEIIVTGHEHIRQGLARELTESLPETRVTEEAFLRIDAEISAGADYNDYRLAVGAAFKPYGGYKIDLFPREDKEAFYFPYIAMMLIGIWMVGVVVTGTFYVLNHGEISNQEQRIAALQDQRQSVEEELRLLSVSGLGQAERKEAIQKIREYRNSPVSILQELEAHMPEGTLLKDAGYTFGSKIDITLYTPQMEQASEYLTSLRDMSFTKEAMIASLTKRQVNPFGSGQDKEQFTAVYQVDLDAGTSLSTLENEGGISDDGTDE
ncbi:pilus assembly protein PilM [Paenibacillus sp. Marseille-Q4541]|uniref:pilus assembly protein PilM n=1 Tax=Paenibacillus sp. Marseille-Q4541 TaxID=2831522 RepID=UPI001BA59483|nr:pilus assembly protein PilM [Paenibacillus sp. Marseille-Q4541]